jgi:hypothetical protein
MPRRTTAGACQCLQLPPRAGTQTAFPPGGSASDAPEQDEGLLVRTPASAEPLQGRRERHRNGAILRLDLEERPRLPREPRPRGDRSSVIFHYLRRL